MTRQRQKDILFPIIQNNLLEQFVAGFFLHEPCCVGGLQWELGAPLVPKTA
jgi:hypothetical protein